MSDRRTYPAKTGAAGAVVWIAVAIAIVAVIGCVWRLLQ
jgi:hypothetical protein